jgi:hypothetical protein
MGYVYEPAGQDGRPLGVRIRADYIRESRDEFSAELVFESTLPGIPPHLHQTRLNLHSTQTKERLAGYLAKRTAAADLPWDKLIEQFAVAVIRQERDGEPVQMVGRMATAFRARDLIEKLLPGSKPSIWFGPGAAGKGWIATLACVCVAEGLPLAGLEVRKGVPFYMDWEDNPYTIDERIKAVAKGLGLPEPPQFAYRKCRRTLPKDLNTLMRMVDDAGADFIVVDSVGLAAGAAGESGYENVALGLFEAIRLFEPRTVLLIDHVTGAAAAGPDAKLAGKAFGSIYKMNEARAAYEVRSEQEDESGVIHQGWYHAKYNHTKRYAPLGLRLEFGPTAVSGGPPEWITVTREDVRDSPGLVQNLTVQEQIAAVLRGGALSTKDIATMTGLGEAVVRTKLNAHKGRRFYQTQAGEWGLMDTLREAPPERPSHLRPVPDQVADEGDAFDDAGNPVEPDEPF